LFLWTLQLLGPQNGIQSSDVTAHLAEAGVVLHLADGELETQIEQFSMRVVQSVADLVWCHVPDLA
jgi:hypothetical protein